MFNDLTGRTFGKLLVVSLVCRNEHAKYVWLCKCECGIEKQIVGNHLLCGETISCGCAGKQNAKVHGDHKVTEYRIWSGIKARCLNPSSPAYKHYGGRGIKICDEWANSYERFLKYVGRRPSLKHSIDRINNDGNYEPSNVRWATAIEQANNRRAPILDKSNKRVIVNKRPITRFIVRQCDNCGKDYSALKTHLALGWGRCCSKSCAASLRCKFKGSNFRKKVGLK